MFVRALIILLLVLNLGVALWWATRAQSPEPEVDVQLPQGVARLQLAPDGAPAGIADDVAGVARIDPAPAPDAGTDAGEEAPAPERCLALGPFESSDAATTAAARLPASVSRQRVRDVVAATRGWGVAMAPLADRAAALAMAERLKQAGFADLYVIGEGAGANGIALGRFSNEGAARSHAESLGAAGFDVRAEPIDGVSSHWVDIAVPGEAFDADAARTLLAAARAEPLDCARLR